MPILSMRWAIFSPVFIDWRYCIVAKVLLCFPNKFRITITENDFWLNLNCTRVVFPYFLLSRFVQCSEYFNICIAVICSLARLHWPSQSIEWLRLQYLSSTERSLGDTPTDWLDVSCYSSSIIQMDPFVAALALVSLGFLVCVYFWFTLRPSTVSILCYTSTAYGPEVPLLISIVLTKLCLLDLGLHDLYSSIFNCC